MVLAAVRVAAELITSTVVPADGSVLLLSRFCFTASSLADAKAVYANGGVDETGRAAQFNITHTNNHAPANRVRVAVYNDAAAVAAVLSRRPACGAFGNGSLLAWELGAADRRTAYRGALAHRARAPAAPD